MPRPPNYNWEKNPFGYPEIYCSDGVKVVWNHSSAPITTVSSSLLIRMRGDNGTLDMLLSHAECTRPQIETLYRRNSTTRDMGHRRRTSGIRIKTLSLETYCEGLAETYIHRILCKFRDSPREALVAGLIRYS